MFYSPSLNAFFHPAVNLHIPVDGIEISGEDHAALLAGQSAGQRIVPGEGGRPELQDPLVAPPPEPTVDDFQRAIAAHVDEVARERSYSDAASCASYVTSTRPAWAAEATAFIAWRDIVYVASFAALAAVEGGGAAPSLEAFIAGLPAISWPA